jgi:iron complex outermembrane receptor protein
MTKENSRASFARRIGVLGLAAVLSAPCSFAFAQEIDGESEEEDGELEQLVTEEITVTGSRIKRNEFNSAAPVSIITSERSQLAGLLEAGDILQGSTIASGQQINDSFSGFVTDGGPGANTISLRGLGAQRTLVLVNGKRWGPSGVRGSTNSVDLTAVPTAIVSRYEILKDGASSVYGADAVAGVINIITRERVDGAQVNIQTRLPGEGGGEGYTADAVWGRVGDNYSFNVGAQYGKQRELPRNERDWGACDIRPRSTDQDGDGNIDNRDPATGEPLCFGFLYGTIFNAGIRYEPTLSDPTDATNPFWDPFWNGTVGLPFWTEAGTGALDNQSDSFYRDDRSWPLEQIVNENDIYSVTSFGDYDFSIADRQATAYYEFYWNKRESRTNGGYRQFFPLVPATNPYNPIGVSSPFGAPAQIVLPSYKLQDPNSYVDVERYNAFIGLRGDLAGSWTYDAYVGYSESDGQYRSDNWLQDRVDASIDGVLDGNGNVVCRDAVGFPGCVSPDFFGAEAQLEGDLPVWRDFASKVTVGDTDYRSEQFNGYVTGDLFALPAGTVGAVLGFEYRREEIDDQPDPEAQADNLWGRTAALATVGDDTVREVYAEAELPLFEGRLLAEQMTLNGSYRYTDYDSYGGDSTYRLALDWQVDESFRIRGTRGTSFRAPDLFEQFLGNETGFLNIIDPCTNYGDDLNPGDVVYDNCASEGLPPNFGGTSSSIRTITGGNQELLAETSDAWTVGFVLTPGDTGISLAWNWFDIELRNTVASPTIGFIVGECYTSLNFSSPFCGEISPRDSEGNLTDIRATLLNIGLQRSKGYDIDILYRNEFDAWDLTIDGTATHLDKQTRDLLGQEDEFVNKWGFPDWSFNVDFRADWRDWTFFWFINWIGNQAEEPATDPDGTIDRPFKTGTRTYHGVSARYTAADWQVTGTVTNLFDRNPPIVGDGLGSQTANRVFNTLPGVGYDLFGRSLVLQLAYSFGGNRRSER